MPPVRTTVSTGIASLSKVEILDDQNLIRFADEALYIAKREDWNRVIVSSRISRLQQSVLPAAV
jgi:GGDEF domain-containing protein